MPSDFATDLAIPGLNGHIRNLNALRSQYSRNSTLPYSRNFSIPPRIITGNSNLDLSINENYFLVLGDENENRYYCRTGNFHINDRGYIVNSMGYGLIGMLADNAGNLTNNQGIISIGNINQSYQQTENVVIDLNLPTDERLTTFSFSTPIDIFDYMGNKHVLLLNFHKLDSSNGAWSLDIEIDGYNVAQHLETSREEYLVEFDTEGRLVTDSTNALSTININYHIDQEFTMLNGVSIDLSHITQRNETLEIRALHQDGFSIDNLNSIEVSEDGTITSKFTNQRDITLGKIGIVNFVNLSQLQMIADGIWNMTSTSDTVEIIYISTNNSLIYFIDNSLGGFNIPGSFANSGLISDQRITITDVPIYNPENTMTNIIYITAQESELKLRQRHNFPISTINSDEEKYLIIQLTVDIHDKITEHIKYNNDLLPFCDDLITATRALSSSNSLFTSNENLSFTDINGYGMKNILALYFKAICNSQGYCQNISYNDAFCALISAIANSYRGNNRNNIDNEDDKEVHDKPICGKGYYNKIAESFVSILQDVNLIFDITDITNKNIKNAIATELAIKYNDKILANKIRSHWNSGDQDEAIEKEYNYFLEYIDSKFDIIIAKFLLHEFASRSKLMKEIYYGIKKQILTFETQQKYISQFNLPELDQFFDKIQLQASKKIIFQWKKYQQHQNKLDSVKLTTHTQCMPCFY